MPLEDPALEPALGPLVRLIDQLEREVAGLDRRIAAAAKANEACRLLMTVPGVGPLVALTYVAGIDDPTRFAKSRNVGVHFGLTPRRWQSGETDRSGGISRAGDAGVRRALYQAANVLIHHSRGWCALKAWAVLGYAERLPHVVNASASARRAQKFCRAASVRIILSSVRSDTAFRSRWFSFSSSFSRFS